ncbi:MAG: hypothetical protein NXH75_17395 [Halobacteriovoraceae bacterium]|nr:hypothetical protein [Halobacteriovoraceae bacterium]
MLIFSAMALTLFSRFPTREDKNRVTGTQIALAVGMFYLSMNYDASEAFKKGYFITLFLMSIGGFILQVLHVRGRKGYLENHPSPGKYTFHLFLAERLALFCISIFLLLFSISNLGDLFGLF